MQPSGDISGISDESIEMYTWFVYSGLCHIINVFGIVTNIINLICFTRQGFEDSVNISLLGLAVSDLGSLITTMWTCISLTPAVLAADLPFEPMGTLYLASAMPHFSFTRASSCITAMITLERCLCITAPLKIKQLITPQRATGITVSVFIFSFTSGTAVYAVNRLGSIFSDQKNKTIVGLISTGNREHVEMISFIINNFIIPFSAFIIIVVCTTILSFKLRSQSKWRSAVSNSNQDDKVSGRNRKAAKMVVMISTLFIICFVPVSINMLAASFIPDLIIMGKYQNISIIISGFGFVLEGINASMNIFIYYYMSSVYRENFVKIFGGKICQVKINN